MYEYMDLPTEGQTDRLVKEQQYTSVCESIESFPKHDLLSWHFSGDYRLYLLHCDIFFFYKMQFEQEMNVKMLRRFSFN